MSAMIAWSLLALFAPSAEPVPSPPTFTGHAAATKELLARSRQRLGDHGVLSIRSRERWTAIEVELVALGWQLPERNPFISVDFKKEMLVLVYKNGDELDAFSVRSYSAGEKPRLEVTMSYVIYKKRAEIVERLNFLLARVPTAPELDVTVSTYHPQNGGPYPTPDKALLEWQGVVGSRAGDIANGLRARIEPAAAAVNTGIDLQMKFVLEFAGGPKVKDGHFASQVESVSVWDGKYSNGYRNHAFQVRTPDGKTVLLRPKEILEWDKNAPHPIAIAAGKPYVLPEWSEGHTLKSLAALGLDTSLPGKYTIVGLYEELSRTIERNGAKHEIWGGTIATNTVTVEVSAP
jgi:hypothetical protein